MWEKASQTKKISIEHYNNEILWRKWYWKTIQWSEVMAGKSKGGDEIIHNCTVCKKYVVSCTHVPSYLFYSPFVSHVSDV